MVPESRNIIHLIIGISICLLTACLSSLGVNLQALALQRERISNVNAEAPLFELDTEYDMLDEDEQTEPERLREEERQYWPAFRIIISNRPAQIKTEAWNFIWIKLQWHIGFLLYILFETFGSVLALGFISPMLIAPLGSLGLVFNILFSRLLLGTQIKYSDFIGTVLIVIGCGIVSSFVIESDKKETLDDLLLLFSRPSFIVYFSIQIALVVIMFLLIKCLDYYLNLLTSTFRSRLYSLRTSSRSNNSTTPIVTEFTDSPLIATDRNSRPASVAEITTDNTNTEEIEPLLSSATVPALPNQLEYSPTVVTSTSNRRGKITNIIGMVFACIGGICASQTLLLTKSGVELFLSAIIDPKNQNTIAGVVLLLLLLCSVGLQLFCLNSALYYNLPVIVVPLFYTVYTCFSLGNTFVCMDQSIVIQPLDIVFLILGIFVIISGVWMLRKNQ